MLHFPFLPSRWLKVFELPRRSLPFALLHELRMARSPTSRRGLPVSPVALEGLSPGSPVSRGLIMSVGWTIRTSRKSAWCFHSLLHTKEDSEDDGAAEPRVPTGPKGMAKAPEAKNRPWGTNPEPEEDAEMDENGEEGAMQEALPMKDCFVGSLHAGTAVHAGKDIRLTLCTDSCLCLLRSRRRSRITS